MSHPAAGTARRLRFEGLESRLALATLYVSPLGSDSGNGSESAPWKTLQKAANSVAAGDTVIVRTGNYAGFHLTRDGTAASPITFRADSGVVVSARNSVTPDGINLEGADYVTIEGFTVNGMPRAGIRSVTNHHATIRNNRTDANGVWGIFTGFSADVLIEGNVTTRSTLEHGIYVSNSADRPTIRGNTSWGNYGNGIHMNGDVSLGGDGIISGGLVENNVIYDNGRGGGSGINADGVQNSVFQNNLLYGNHASGMSLYRIDGGGGSSGNLVVNNTIIGAADSRWALNINTGSVNNTVLNNVLYTHHSVRGSITISADSLPGFTSDYNVVMNRFTTNDGMSVIGLAQWRSATGQDLHSIIATPDQLFVNAGANDYHLSATSPALDAGTTLRAPSRDIEAVARPSGAGIDIGAFERFVEELPICPLPEEMAQGDPAVNDVIGFDVQHGADQRSFIRYLDLTFECDAELNQLVSEGRVRLTRFALDGSGSGASVSLAGRTQVVGKTVQIDFGSGGIGRKPNGTTGNGYYRLALDADGNGDFETTRHFYRLLGDTNGDRVVDSLDQQAVDAAFGQTGINLNADVNGDGVVNRRDRTLVNGQLGRRVAAALPLDD